MNNYCGLYTKKVMESFKNPKNIGVIKNADGVGKAGNIVCGDEMFIYLKIRKDKKGNDVIKDIKFKTYGCVAAVSTSSMITELAKGKTIEEAIKISKDDIVKSLGGLPKIKYHCSILAIDALNEAIYDYFKKNSRKIPEIIEKNHVRIEKSNKIIENRSNG